jgi:hypothetical protein
MLERVLATAHNWFDYRRDRGEFVIENGVLQDINLADGQYFRIVGSLFNDGLHKAAATDLIDETFTGAVWYLAVPVYVQELAERVSEWCANNPETDKTSESFGGYSYSKGGNTTGWAKAFASELANFRRV